MTGLNLTSAALLIIDMQKYFLEEEADAYLGKKSGKIIPKVEQLIKVFHGRKKPVVFTRHAHRKGEPTGQMGRWWKDKLPWEGEAQADLIEELKLQKEDLLITKTKYSAFQKTQLEDYLKQKKIDTVVICGVMTHLCVETTARQAFLLDFQPVLVEDACATQSKAHHEATLLNLAHGFAHIVKAEDVIKRIQE